MRILGLSAFGSDSGAALLVDGVPVAAAAEERFTGLRREAGFPRRAARYCLNEAGLAGADLDWAVYHLKPLKAFERVLVSQLRAFPAGGTSFARNMYQWLGDKLWIRDRIATELGLPHERVLFVEHHVAHAAAAFLPSPYEEAAVLIVDGAGEWATTSLHHGRGSRIELLDELRFPHSLGLFLSAMAEQLGFPARGGEARVLELAAYGQPVRAAELRALLRPGAAGSFELDASAFRFPFDTESAGGTALQARLGAPRAPGAPLRHHASDSADADLAASVALVLRETLATLAAELHRRVPCAELCVGGELAGHPGLLADLLRDGPFTRLFVPSAPGDAGAALGAALAVTAELASASTNGDGGARAWRQPHDFLGEPVALQSGSGTRLQDEDAVLEALLAAEFFELPAGADELLRFQQLAVRVRLEARERIPAVVHADGSARPQLVSAADDPLLHALLLRFDAAAGVPLLLQTALALRGDPPVRGEQQALTLFERSRLPALVIEDRLHLRA